MRRGAFILALASGLGAQHEIPPTANGPVGAERFGLRSGELRETGSCTACEQPSKGERTMAPLAGETHKRSTANRHRSKCWPEQRAQLAGRESDGGSRFAGRPSTGIRAGWWQRHLGDTAIHLGATSLDMASSWGRPERHPLLKSADGRFGARGIGLKLAVFGTVEGAKWLLLRRGESGRWVRSLSLVPAATFGAVAAHNWKIR